MGLLWIVSLLIFAGAAVVTEANRIVGGSPTTVENYPAIVQVDFRSTWNWAWSQSCGANILNSLYVVSAAHCFSGASYLTSAYRRVRVGSSGRNTGGEVIYIVREFNHPSYNVKARYDGDISVVRLETPLTYSPAVQQGAIAPQGLVLNDNLPVVHAGWGAVSADGESSPVLMDVTIFTINHELCKQRYADINSVVTENMICAGILDVGGKDACQGDSGGPLYFRDILVGVVSWGNGCANETYPGISTAVGQYSDWIVATAV